MLGHKLIFLTSYHSPPVSEEKKDHMQNTNFCWWKSS